MDCELLAQRQHMKFEPSTISCSESAPVALLFYFFSSLCLSSLTRVTGFRVTFPAQSVERLLVKSCWNINLSSARLPSPRFAFIGVPTFDISIPSKTPLTNYDCASEITIYAHLVASPSFHWFCVPVLFLERSMSLDFSPIPSHLQINIAKV